jgi:seryl-tRNA synthetase
LDELNKSINKIQKDIGLKMKAKEDASTLIAQKNDVSKQKEEKEKQVKEKEEERDARLLSIGNIVAKDVPTSMDEVR